MKSTDPDMVAFVALMNLAINHENPAARIGLAKRLVFGFGRMFFAPPETIEQLVAKFQQEIEHYRSDENEHAANPESTRIAANHVAFLNTFLKHRAAMIETLREFGIKI